MIIHVTMNICFPYAGFWDYNTSSAEASIEMEWQLVERQKQSVVYSRITGGTAETKRGVQMGVQVTYDAFAQAVRNLLAEESFVNLVSKPLRCSTSECFSPLRRARDSHPIPFAPLVVRSGQTEF